MLTEWMPNLIIKFGHKCARKAFKFTPHLQSTPTPAKRKRGKNFKSPRAPGGARPGKPVPYSCAGGHLRPLRIRSVAARRGDGHGGRGGRGGLRARVGRSWGRKPDGTLKCSPFKTDLQVFCKLSAESQQIFLNSWACGYLGINIKYMHFCTVLIKDLRILITNKAWIRKEEIKKWHEDNYI